MNYIEEYQQIASQYGLPFSDNQNEMNAFGADNGNKVRIKYAVIQKENLFYCAYDMYAPKAYMNPKYSNLTYKINQKMNPSQSH